MRIAENLPAVFERLKQIGGVLDYVVFEEAQGGDGEALAAMARAVPGWRESASEALSPRKIDQRTFFGEWYDATTRSLLSVGEHWTSDGKVLVNPRLKDLDGICIASSAFSNPELGRGGEFAYAFSSPPYGLRAPPGDVQELFDGITAFILPAGFDHTILDWTSPRLPEASPYFEAGMQWWGVLLFTIHVPALQRLTVIAGSTTD